MRIVFAGGGTGGHLYPGLAIARALVRLEPRVRPFFIGAERGIEKEVLPGTEFEHELLDLHPLYRSRPWRNWKTVTSASHAWGRLTRIFAAVHPAVVVGTGGYAAGLALARARALRVPIALQEQNSFPGLTMRFFSRWAKEVYLGFPEAERHLSRRAAHFVDSGNPIEPPPVSRPTRSESRARWGFPADDSPVILVVGGSQGAGAVNEVVAGAVTELVHAGARVIWATGKAHHSRYAHLESESVRVRPYLAPIADAYAATDLAISRAGAITTAELCAWGIPGIVIPLPTAAADHQTANARALERAGCAIMLEQQSLTATVLAERARGLLGSAEQLAGMSAAATKRGRPHAAEVIAKHILGLAKVK